MSMLQLLGGVAVAGAVAAGTTAFTAGGLTKTGLSATNDAFLGGTVSQTVHGADLTSLKLEQAAHASLLNSVSGATLVFDANTPIGAKVSLSTDGTLDNTNTGTGFFCTDVALNGSDHESVCTVGKSGTPDTNDFYYGVTTVTITVTA